MWTLKSGPGGIKKLSDLSDLLWAFSVHKVRQKSDHFENFVTIIYVT